MSEVAEVSHDGTCMNCGSPIVHWRNPGEYSGRWAHVGPDISKHPAVPHPTSVRDRHYDRPRGPGQPEPTALEELAALVRHASPLSLAYGPEQSCHRIGPGRLVDQRAWEQWCKKWGQEA